MPPAKGQPPRQKAAGEPREPRLLRQQALELGGRFRSGLTDLSVEHDRYIEEAFGIRGIAEIGQADLAQYFGQGVIVTGKAMFRPSGSILRIEADNLEPAAGNVSIWSRAPRPLRGKLDRQSLVKPPGPLSGINAIIGRWPGDETEEDILEALEEIS